MLCCVELLKGLRTGCIFCITTLPSGVHSSLTTSSYFCRIDIWLGALTAFGAIDFLLIDLTLKTYFFICVSCSSRNSISLLIIFSLSFACPLLWLSCSCVFSSASFTNLNFSCMQTSWTFIFLSSLILSCLIFSSLSTNSAFMLTTDLSLFRSAESPSNLSKQSKISLTAFTRKCGFWMIISVSRKFSSRVPLMSFSSYSSLYL